MAHITLSVPEEIRELMGRHPELNWSEVARQAFKEKALQLELLDSIASTSRLTNKDALEIGRKIKKGMRERYRDRRE
jgi:hypothetical protein